MAFYFLLSRPRQKVWIEPVIVDVREAPGVESCWLRSAVCVGLQP